MKYRHILAHKQRFIVLMLVINHLGLRLAWLRPTAYVVYSYSPELQTVVNELIYNGNSYFIL